MFSEIAEIALVAARLGQFLQFLKTRVILILNFTRPHAITHTYRMSRAHFSQISLTNEMDSSLVPVSFITLYDFDLNEAIDVYDN